MATSRFVQVTNTEIDEININSIPKNTKDATKFGLKLFQGMYFIFSINSVLHNVNNTLGLQIISRKNITLIYKRSTIISFNKQNGINNKQSSLVLSKKWKLAR